MISFLKFISPRPVGGPSKKKKMGALGTCPVCLLVKTAVSGGTISQPGRVRTRKRAVAVGCRRRVDVPRCTSLPAPSTGTTADERQVRRRRSAGKRNKNKLPWLLKLCGPWKKEGTELT